LPIARALYHRGFTDAESARLFFNPEPDAPTDPYRMADMEKAAKRISRAVSAGEPIAVYGDYDTDGVTAAALLTNFLISRGGSVTPYIPNRFEEGYGLNCTALENLSAQGIRLVVSVDCGARSIAEAEYARSAGLELIITDHHAPGDDHPPAYAFLDPKRQDCPYPDKNLAGVGVAFRLLQALALMPSHREGPAAEEYLDLVAIGTVADMAPLVGENRDLVRAGLDLLNRTDAAPLRTGLDSLIQTAGVRRGGIDSTAIGFMLGPRLNAAGRMDTATQALKLLLTRNPQEADELAGLLDSQNRERQTLTRSTYQAARKIILDRQQASGTPLPYFLLAEQEGFNTGIIGLAASKLMDEFYRPSAVVALDGGSARGSIRSIPGFHITKALDACSELLERYGGHAAAAGFTLPAERLGELSRRMEQLAQSALDDNRLTPTLELDAEIKLDELTWNLLDWLRRFEPSGQGNPRPVFAVRNVRILTKRTVGKDNAHLKLRVGNGEVSMDAIGFGMGPVAGELSSFADVAFALEENNYYGRQLQMRMIDVRNPGEGTAG
jgi:single-stranded-DNA-specific exonuclease